jgi:DNA-binding response OmpR family regulator
MTNELIKQSVLTEGVDAYLQKPYDAQVLLDTINKILGKSAVGETSPASTRLSEAGPLGGKDDSPQTQAPPADSAVNAPPEEPTLFDFAQSKNQAGK